MNKKSNYSNKILIAGIIFIFIGAILIPSISSNNITNQFLNRGVNFLPLNEDYVNSYWRFNECEGDIVGDSSIPHYNGTIHGATWGGSEGDCLLIFDGVDDYVNFSDYASEILINNTDDIIVTFIFKSSGAGVIFSGTASWGYNPEFRIELMSNGTLLFYTVMSFQGTRLYSTGTYNDGAWHTVEYYFNGISTAPTATLYVDDELDNSVTHYLHDFENIDFKKATMGVHVHTFTDYFDGMLEDFKIIKYEKGNDQDPPIISGPPYGQPGEEIEFTFTNDDPEEDDVQIMVDWGDGDITEWSEFIGYGEDLTLYHSWAEENEYCIKAKTMDIWDDSPWSDCFNIKIDNQPRPIICCDPIGMNFGDVSAGDTLYGEIHVLSCGDPGSYLNFYVDTNPEELPSWGTWTFSPESGEGVAEGDSVKVDVTCVVTETQGAYSGIITIVNTDNPSDKCVVDTSVNVPRTRSYYNPLILSLLDKFPMLEWLFNKTFII
jgi:hypothetical protein